MAAWRRHALEAFPELRRELTDAHEIFSVYALWFELLPRVRNAHRSADDDFLRRAYGFGEWCYHQGGYLENAVAAAFYEHLFDERWMRPLVPRWLPKSLAADVWPLWEARLSVEDQQEVKKLLAEKPRFAKPSY
jgi:hypothetical protein